ncbi:alpha/beta hydrolase [Planctomicrobium piriforme]|uniref:Acetyl esterase/lipase n=1 Tax=Planctomicrobium piriforme TaxID=1576369 RepID=A0A1I3BLJ9_9PLAN|nr:alpha/beta hydrolase [Planctomicrobium piriforme]SFH63050.1 Acetyl esterase/lipase [Planctomicrobium piriforme]
MQAPLKSLVWAVCLCTLLGFVGEAATTSAAEPVVPPGITLERGIVFGKGGEQELKLDIAYPKSTDGQLPALVFIHGGGWVGGDREAFLPLIVQFSQAGIVCLTVDYRLAPQHRFPAQLEDVKCAVRWLRANAEKYHVDPQRIAAFGASAGAHLAALLGTTNGDARWEGSGGNADQSSSVCAVVGLSGAYDLTLGYENSVKQSFFEGRSVRGMLESFLGGKPADKGDAYRSASPVEHVQATTPPMILVHGTADTLVPIEQSEVMEQKLKAAGVDVEFFRLEGGTHSSFGKDAQQSMLKISESIRARLQPAAAK